MALGSEAAEERYEVCPTEDLVRALIENLVDPSLPSRVSKNDPPDLSVQQAVAKQVWCNFMFCFAVICFATGLKSILFESFCSSDFSGNCIF